MRVRAATLAPVLLCAEVVICIAVLLLFPYTEIDWVAYMQQVAGFVGGELDYVKLRGVTGPLVYPAGFLYIFSALYSVTDGGTDLFRAQCIFIVIYLLTTAVVFSIYRACKAPPLLLVLLILSHRIHSIFFLRLFNDSFSMLLLYAAVLFFVRRRWALGCVLYSAAVSIKMNIFLFAPALLFLLCSHLSPRGVAGCLAICAAVQLALGAPFLATHPVSYLSKAFELSRVFSHYWSANLFFLPEEWFDAPALSPTLLLLTVASWAVLWRRRWARRNLSDPGAVAATLFESNLVGVVLARSLHNQFYAWFFHQLPFVLYYSTPAIPSIVRLTIIVVIEVAFNVMIATWWSSAMLFTALLTVLAGMLTGSDRVWPLTAAKRPGADHSCRPSKGNVK